MTRDVYWNTVQVEKITWERLRTDVIFVIRYFKTGFSEELGLKIQLMTDHKVAVGCLLDGVNVFAVLQTGFGKSLIFQG